MLEEIESAGFEGVELGFHFKKSEIQELKEEMKYKAISVVSLHNFCPFPLEEYRGFPSPDFYSLSSLEPEERKLALKATEQTLETAYQFGAKVVLLHSGRIDGLEDLTRYFFELRETQPEKYVQEMAEYLEQRRKLGKKHIDRLKFSLEKLLLRVEKLDLKIALESRYYLSEIPELEELEEVLSCFSCNRLGYWHDSGHVEVRSKLEIHSQEEYLNLLSSYLLGIHYHDVEGIDDHKLPGQGELDFSVFKPYLDCLKVLEVHPPAEVVEVQRAKEYLERILSS